MSLPKRCTPLSTPVKAAALAFPFVLWCCLYRNFLTGEVPIHEDTFSAYALVKYLITNLRLGLLPHWVPFIHWGMADVYQIGEFNPMWLFTLALNLAGVPVYIAFVATIALYFWVGALGVYGVARRLLGDRFSAYFGYVLFLLSSVGMTVFTQINLVLVFVPAVWFFYFLAVFYQEGKRYAVLGLAFTGMLVLTTYIPFYFLIACACALLFGAVLYPAVVVRLAARAKHFCGAHPFFAIAAVAGVAAAAVQAYFNWTLLSSGFVALARPAVMDYAAVQNAGIPIEEVARDTSIFHFFLSLLQLPTMTFVKDIFSLTNIPSDDQRIFYVPILAHIVLFAACFIPLRRNMIFWGGTAFLLFMIALAGLTPVYAFLFHHVPFFNMFRNIFFLEPFIVMAYAVFAAQMWRAFWVEAPPRSLGRGAGALFLLGLYWWYWFKPGYFLLSSQLTVAAFLLLVAGRFIGVLQARGAAAKCLLIAVAVLGPIEVLHAHSRAVGDTRIIGLAVPAPVLPFSFSFTRPLTLSLEAPEPLDIYHLFNWYIIQMQDEPGNRMPYGYPTRYSQELAAAAANIPGFAEYARHKFVVYERYDDRKVFADAPGFAAWFPVQPAGRYIDSDTRDLTVARFNANQLYVRTRFLSRSLLVYNDSYHPFWQVQVDGKQEALVRANYAFKGVWVPAGEHEVRFEFKPPGGGGWALTVFALFQVFFAALGWCLVRRI